MVELLLIAIMLISILINIETKHESYSRIVRVFAASGFRLMPSSKRMVSSIQSLRYALPSINNIIKEFPSMQILYQKDNLKTKIDSFRKKSIFWMCHSNIKIKKIMFSKI